MQKLIATLLIALLTPFLAYGEDQIRKSPGEFMTNDKVEKGWFWYEDPAKKKEPDAEVAIPRSQAQKPKEENPCTKADTWTVSCGFIEPGNSFEFQAKQRDELMQNMAMNPKDPKAVESFQYYMKWAVEKATAVANMWQYNMVQNPDLDPKTKAPVSEFGLKLMSEVKEANSKEIFSFLSKEAALVYFSRHDCSFCHVMKKSVLAISEESGIPAWNAALDSKCIPDFKICKTEAETLKPAQVLQVSVVPALFLYVQPNTWIRVANGITDEATMKARIVDFFSAYRTAMLKGTQPNGSRPPVDFDYDKPTGAANTGITLPSEKSVETLMKGSFSD